MGRRFWRSAVFLGLLTTALVASASTANAAYHFSSYRGTPPIHVLGGTSLKLTSSGDLSSETAWEGSGGGVSAYEKEPTFQSDYSIPKAGGMRAIPDVSYDADPHSGFPIYRLGKWRQVGGTSAGAPQWAAIASLGKGISLQAIYADKASSGHRSFFRDIMSGTNGECGYLCGARKRYDYVTGLGSPQTVNF